MLVKWWLKIESKFENVKLCEFTIMPDHFHAIIQIYANPVGADPRVCPSTQTNIPTIIQWFKTMTTNEYIKNVKQNNWPRFHKRLWQRNYYERTVRNSNEFQRTVEYIRSNPSRYS